MTTIESLEAREQMRLRVRDLENALNGFIGFVRGGYAQEVSGSYQQTLQILVRKAEEVLGFKR